MSKLDDFKLFVRDNPKLINYVKNDSMTWQKFYEIYDLYGKDSDVWSKYLSEEKAESKDSGFSISKIEDVVNMVKKMDVDKVQEGITSLQKAVDLFSSLFIKNESTPTSGSSYTPRPIYRSFED